MPLPCAADMARTRAGIPSSFILRIQAGLLAFIPTVGALIGGLVGAGAGTAGAAMTGGKAATLPAESVVRFTTAAPITITVTEKSTAADQ